MQKYSYLEIELHKKEHLYFIDRVKEFQERFRERNLKLIEIVLFLKNWFFNHIKECDKKLGPFLHKIDK
ncbi:hypothetical protein ACFL35_20180 [Candidatus Riflebacteria bacterium]